MQTLTDITHHWRTVDTSLADLGAAPATLGELRSTLENAPRPEDAALLIVAMRYVSANVLTVYEGALQ